MISAVVCVLKSGGIYDASWVDRLHTGLIRWWPHRAPPFKLLCLTDTGDIGIPGVTSIPLKHNWPGWWSKIEMFGPMLPKVQPGRVTYLYLDLDTVITGPLDQLWAASAPLIALRDPETTRVASGILKFTRGWHQTVGKAIYAEMAENPTKCVDELRDGDQQLISKHTLRFGPGGNVLTGRWLQDVCPGFALSYKREIGIGGGARGSIVYFHGEPKPCDIPPGDPVRRLWEDQ